MKKYNVFSEDINKQGNTTEFELTCSDKGLQQVKRQCYSDKHKMSFAEDQEFRDIENLMKHDSYKRVNGRIKRR